MKLITLKDVFKHEIMDLLDAEEQISKALIEVKKKATDEQLIMGIEEHYKQTQEHIQRLKKVCKSLEFKVVPKECKGIRGIIEEGKELLTIEATNEARDAALIGALQRVEHYEIVAYGCSITYAEQLGYFEEAEILKETLAEEEETDSKLTLLAESSINERAQYAEGGGAYVNT